MGRSQIRQRLEGQGKGVGFALNMLENFRRILGKNNMSRLKFLNNHFGCQEMPNPVASSKLFSKVHYVSKS